MGCCGMFSKSSKKTAAGGANGFAPRPVQQTGYAPTAAALDNQKKYNSEFRKQYGGDPNDPEFLKSLAANQALAGSATDFAIRKMGPQGQKFDGVARKGANMAATQYTKQQFGGR